MAEKLVEITRNDLIECIHRGDVAVVDYKGRLLYKTGDAFKCTYLRSAAKFFQALNVVLSGAGDYYNFSDREYAITCASHYAEPFHLRTIKSILNKAELTPEHIQAGITTSLKWEYALELAQRNEKLTPLHTDCSGKHAGMLATARYLEHPLDTYTELLHPVQQDILDHISYITQYPKDQIKIGIDGCGVPVHAMPLYYMAWGFARFARPEALSKEYSKAGRRLFQAAIKHPEMLAGTGGFCSRLVANSNGKLIGKIGAEGVYGVAIRNKGLGIAVKMESGSMNVLPPVVMKILETLNLLTANELQALSHYREMPNLNDLNTRVGSIRPAFKPVQLL